MTVLEIAYDLLDAYAAAEIERLTLKGASQEEIEAAQEEIDDTRARLRSAEIAEISREDYGMY